MKLFQCRQMGEVNNLKCYDCFTNHLANESYPTRVLCKRSNIKEEISLSTMAEQTELPLEKVV